MKKLIKCLLLIIVMFFTYTVNAEVIDNDDVPNGTYVIGTHTFDRNKTDNYDGTLTVQHIMLAAKTIESNNLEDMKIYFKNSRGKWMNPIDNSVINSNKVPNKFEVKYKNIIEIKELTKEEQLNELLNKFPNDLSVDVYKNASLTVTGDYDALIYKLTDYIIKNNIEVNFYQNSIVNYDNNYWMEIELPENTDYFDLFVHYIDSPNYDDIITLQKRIKYKVNYIDLSSKEVQNLNNSKNEINNLTSKIEKEFFDSKYKISISTKEIIDNALKKYNLEKYEYILGTGSTGAPIEEEIKLIGGSTFYFIAKDGVLYDIADFLSYGYINFNPKLNSNDYKDIDEYSKAVLKKFENRTNIKNYKVDKKDGKDYELFTEIASLNEDGMFEKQYIITLTDLDTKNAWRIRYSQYTNLLYTDCSLLPPSSEYGGVACVQYYSPNLDRSKYNDTESFKEASLKDFETKNNVTNYEIIDETESFEYDEDTKMYRINYSISLKDLNSENNWVIEIFEKKKDYTPN